MKNVVVAHNSASDGRCATVCKDCGHGSHERDRGRRQLPSTLIAKKGGFEERAACWCRTPTLGPTASARTPRITWCGRPGPAAEPGLLEGKTDRAREALHEGDGCARPEPVRGQPGALRGAKSDAAPPGAAFDVKALHISPSWTDKAALRNRSCLPTSFATKIAKRLHKVTEPKHRPHNYYARFKMNLHFPGSTRGRGVLPGTSPGRPWHAGPRRPRLQEPSLEHGRSRAHLEARRRGALLPRPGARYDPFRCRPRLGGGDGARGPQEPGPRGEAQGRCSGRRPRSDLPGCLEQFLAAALSKIRERHAQSLVLDHAGCARAALRGANCSGLVEYRQAHPTQDDTQLGLHKAIERRVRVVPLPAAKVVPKGEDPACAALVNARCTTN